MPDTLIDVVCFDVGNVLVELSSGWPEAFAQANVAMPAAAEDEAVLQRLDMLNREHECGRIDAEGFDAMAAACTGLAPRDIDAASRAWIKRPFSGIVALLEAMAASGTTTACLSNTNDRHWAMFHGAGANRSTLPLHLLDYRMASHLIGAMKPAETVFQHAEAVTATAPAGILFFDDAEVNCVAARRRGWRVCRIDPGNDPAKQMRRHLRKAGVL